MRTILSFAALLLSVALVQLSSGGVGPLDALSGLALGFGRAEIGLLGSAHFLGFFIGCWWAPRLMGNVGHSRAFAVFTALGAMAMLTHMMWVNPLGWAVMRITSGLCVAGSYTVIEAWMNARVENTARGRIMGGYRLVDLSGSLAAQLMIGVLPPATYLSYNVLALLACAALLPLAMTRTSQPEVPKAPRLRPALAWAMSPLAVAGVIVAGLTSAAFRMVGPVYGQEVGLQAAEIAWFLAAFVAGGALAQFPAGWLADRYDRRWVLIWLSAAAITACAATIFLPAATTGEILAKAAFFGFTTFPIFSLAAAHAHDYAETSQRVELSAALMFWFAIGAIASPLVTSSLIEVAGPGALFAFIAMGHVVLILFGLARMLVRPGAETRTAYVYAPRTSFAIGRLMGRLRERK